MVMTRAARVILMLTKDDREGRPNALDEHFMICIEPQHFVSVLIVLIPARELPRFVADLVNGVATPASAISSVLDDIRNC